MKNIKTKLFFILLFGIGLTTVEAQTTVTTSGGNASSFSGSASYSVGQLVFNTNSNSSGSETRGVQQPYEITMFIGLEEINGIKLNLSAYPNPMIDFITLKVDKDNNNDLTYQIIDINGRLLANKNVLDNETNIQVSNFVSGTYFLKVLQNNKEVKTFKIIKN